MSQDQQRRNQEQQQHQEQHDLSLRDVAMMQSADNTVLRETRNERAGVVISHDRSTDVSEDVNGVTITETFIPGGRIITEFVARQVYMSFINI